jgi:hypothetical protein
VTLSNRATLALILIVATALNVVGVLLLFRWARAIREGTLAQDRWLRPIPGLPRAPSYFLVCLFGASWNAIIVRSLWATVFCIALGALFKLSEEWTESKKTTTVILGGMFVLIANLLLYQHGYYGRWGPP